MLSFAACGSSGRVSVSGTVTVNGTPLAEGSIELISGTTSAGATVENGAYTIPAAQGPVPGTYRVEIKAMRKTGRQIVDAHQPPPNNMVDEMEQFIPPQYNSDSTLSAEIKPGANRNLNFQLNVEAGKNAAF